MRIHPWFKTGVCHSEIESLLRNKKFPYAYPTFITDYINSYVWRTWYIKNVGYSLISLSWIEPLSKWIGNRKVLELMSGSGALSYALSQNNVNVIATDHHKWKDHNDEQYWENKYWTDIENLDALEALEIYGKDVDLILLSWAPINETAKNIIVKMREVNPNLQMIFIGEGKDGCTADDDFFSIISDIDDESFYSSVKDYQSFFGIYDKPRLIK
jgi:hypothetical protein